ncbi:ABC transporter substrate-binding protein [Serpentinicella alkaliphila]|uniref:Iron complex transport system substrate-binding protein n=1 Tax=Serpentinicella alkaliphila TaxID=1734049 RepID=A0A4R2TMZ8_9FIRM|nr:ABC transporter substrate-binding protein [Serpentinicella alkaliphila]QUH24430.1 ABC transporter substrate-binding protein [Serpentinicella alkaliphila]TCQ04176.1 iron complex transport system substrate-binding protein [Serpentinicella alkaliphila]
MKNKIIKIIVSVLIINMIMTGCNSLGQADNTGNNNMDIYPLTIIDSYENEVIIEEMPNRVISIAPSITEIIFNLGLEDKLVGRTDFCNFPLEAESIESIGSLTSPNIEKIIELEPDLIIASTHFQKEVYDKLSELQIKLLVLDSKGSFDGVYMTIEKIGKVFNVNNKALELIRHMKSTVEEVLDKLKDEPKPTVYYVVGFGEYGDFTAGGDTFINDMLEMAGAINIASEVTGWKYSLERIIEQDPHMLIVSKYYNTKDEIMVANGYSELTAIKEGRVYEIDNNLLDRQGPRIALGLKELAKIVHPNLFE